MPADSKGKNRPARLQLLGRADRLAGLMTNLSDSEIASQVALLSRGCELVVNADELAKRSPKPPRQIGRCA